MIPYNNASYTILQVSTCWH